MSPVLDDREVGRQAGRAEGEAGAVDVGGDDREADGVALGAALGPGLVIVGASLTAVTVIEIVATLLSSDASAAWKVKLSGPL